MKFCLLEPLRAVRRHGAIAFLATLVILGFAALALLDVADRRGDAALAANQELGRAAEHASAILDRHERGLTALAAVAATGSDDMARQFLDRVRTLAPGIRGAAILDPDGTVQFRSGGDGLAESALDALSANAAREAVARPQAALLVTRTAGEATEALVGLARPWSNNAEGRLSGIALVAVDRSAFAGLDLARSDGAPLFGENAKPGTLQIALGDLPLQLIYALPMKPALTWPVAVVALTGVAALLGLLALLVGRLSAAKRAIARFAASERELRDRLAATAAVVDRTDELTRAKSQFFAQVTHELRTPLNAILGFSETIRQQIFGPVANTRYLEYAGLIHDAGSHLLSLINDLLDEARIEAGKMEISPIRVSTPALARSALDLVELLAEGRDLAVTTIGLSSCPDLNVDLRAMKQVLVNLLSNAIKYTQPGGRIDLRFAARGGGATIEIADTGIGMSAEDLRTAFEPFGRAGGIAARRQQGTGLGLSLARALVRLHGGELRLASRLDHGTTATIILPEGAVFAANAAKAA